MNHKHGRLIWLGAALSALSLPADAAGILTTIAGQYEAAAAGWMSKALTYALHLFYLLIGIELAASAIGYLFSKDSLADFFAALLVKLLGVLFFWVLLQQAPVWIPTIMQSFVQAGAAIGGVTTLDPSSVFEQGIAVANIALQGVNDASIFKAFALIMIAGLSALTIVIAYAVIAAQLLVTLVESYVVIGGGVLMLGFAGSRWTMVFTERYFGYVVSVGIKLFVLYLIIGLGTTLAPQFMALFSQTLQQGLPSPSLYLDIMGAALVFMILGWHVPSLASSLMSGAPSLTLGTAASTAAMTGALVANAVAKGMQTAISTTRQSTDAVASAAKLTQAATAGLMDQRAGGASLSTAVSKTAGDVIQAANQQFRDSVIRGTGRESAAAAERAAGKEAVQGWGRGTPLGNLTNRVYANRTADPATPPPGGSPTAPGSSTPPPPSKPTRHINRIHPPPVPPDSGHGGNITIRFKQPE